MTAPEGVVDAIEPDGTHVYWSTYCRHAVLVEATDPPWARPPATTPQTRANRPEDGP